MCAHCRYPFPVFQPFSPGQHVQTSRTAGLHSAPMHSCSRLKSQEIVPFMMIVRMVQMTYPAYGEGAVPMNCCPEADTCT